MSAKISRKDYENAGGDCLVNSNAWFAYRDVRSPQGVANYLTLFGHNKAKFKEAFGKQSCCWDGWVRWWIWKIPLEDGFLYAMSSVEGTSYEVVGNSYAAYTPRESFEVACTQAIALLKELFKEELK